MGNIDFGKDFGKRAAYPTSGLRQSNHTKRSKIEKFGPIPSLNNGLTELITLIYLFMVKGLGTSGSWGRCAQ